MPILRQFDDPVHLTIRLEKADKGWLETEAERTGLAGGRSELLRDIIAAARKDAERSKE